MLIEKKDLQKWYKEERGIFITDIVYKLVITKKITPTSGYIFSDIIYFCAFGKRQEDFSCFLSDDFLVKRHQIRRESISRILKQLEEINLIKIKIDKKNNKKWSTKRTIFLTKKTINKFKIRSKIREKRFNLHVTEMSRVDNKKNNSARNRDVTYKEDYILSSDNITNIMKRYNICNIAHSGECADKNKKLINKIKKSLSENKNKKPLQKNNKISFPEIAVKKWIADPDTTNNSPKSKNYIEAVLQIKKLNNGKFLQNKIFDEQWISKNKIDLAKIKMGLSEKEIINAIDNCLLYLKAGYWPEDKKANKWMKNINAVIYNPRTQKSLLLLAFFNPPKLIGTKKLSIAEKEALSIIIDEVEPEYKKQIEISFPKITTFFNKNKNHFYSRTINGFMLDFKDWYVKNGFSSINSNTLNPNSSLFKSFLKDYSIDFENNRNDFVF